MRHLSVVAVVADVPAQLASSLFKLRSLAFGRLAGAKMRRPIFAVALAAISSPPSARRLQAWPSRGSGIKLSLTIIPLLTVAACSSAKPSPDDVFAEQVRGHVRGSLKDPESAKFQEVKAYAKEQVACGKVNAKNSYGGYTGFEDFSYYQGQSHLQSGDVTKYVVGAGRCTIASAKRSISEIQNADYSPADKQRLIEPFEKVIADINQDPTFGG